MGGVSPLAIAGLLVVLFLAALDGTIVGTAMPKVVAVIGGMELYPWTFSGFMLASTVVMPFFGKFADLYGTRTCIFVAIAVFLLGSAACGAAPTMPWLVAARALQGMGAGGIITLIMIAFGQLFAPEVRGKAQGLVSMVWGVSSLVGPLVGGLIVEYFAWQWVFLINLPVGLVAAVVIYVALPRHLQERKPHRIELGAAALLVGGLVTTMVALSNADSPVLLALPIGLACLGAFCWQQTRSPEPIIPMSMFANRVYAVGGAVGFLASFTMFSALSYVPLFAQGVLGRSPAEAGVVLTPMMFAWPVASAGAGVLVNRLGFRKLVLAGATSMLVGYCLLAVLGADTPLYPLVAGASFLGAGMGVMTSTCLVAVQVSVPRTQLGAASATLGLLRNVGAAFGLSMLGGFQLYWMTAGIQARALTLPPEQAALLAEPRSVLHQVGAGHWPAPVAEVLRLSLHQSLHVIFVASLGVAVACLLLALRMPALTPLTAAEGRGA